MSEHYTLSFLTEIDNTASAEDIAVIDYLFDGEGSAPAGLPKHTYFEQGLIEKPFNQQYRDFPKNAYLANTWFEEDRQNNLARRFIELRLPSQKLESIYEHGLPFVSWLASISVKTGFVGFFSLEDAPDFTPTLLFIHQRELFMGSTKEAHSFSTGTKLAAIV